MENRTFRNTKRKHNRVLPFRNDEKATHTLDKQFRLSDLNLKNAFIDLPSSNDLLYQFNVVHNPLFNKNKEIQIDFLTDELLKGLGDCFNVNPLKFGIMQEFIVVQEPLDFDIYEFDLKPFFKLKYKSPKLFEAFGFFVKNCNISILDKQDNLFFDFATNDYLEEIASDTEESQLVKKHIIKAIESIYTANEKLTELNTTKTKEEILLELNNYKVKNNIYAFIKETLLDWLNLDFSFITDYPYEYYNEEKTLYNDYNEDDEELEREDKYCSLEDAIVFKYNSNPVITKTINESRQSFTENSMGISSACWIIKNDTAELYKKNQIEKFKSFSAEYFEIVKLITVL